MRKRVKVWCPDCKKYVVPLEFWEPTEEGARDIMWGADPESVSWELHAREATQFF